MVAKFETRRAIRKARKFMGRKSLSEKERLERDSLVSKLAENGNPGCAAALRDWAVSGSVWLRPEPGLLGKAIAYSALDEAHVKGILGMISGGRSFGLIKNGGEEELVEKSVPVYEQYYLSLLLYAELDERLETHGTGGIMFMLHGRMAMVVDSMERHMPEMVESFWRAREALKE